jgi:hypothetical protein
VIDVAISLFSFFPDGPALVRVIAESVSKRPLLPSPRDFDSKGDSRISRGLIRCDEHKRFAMPIPLRLDLDAQMVRAAARRLKDGPQARRLLALAAIYDGATRSEAAKIGGVTVQIVRDWVVKFNALGPTAS